MLDLRPDFKELGIAGKTCPNNADVVEISRFNEGQQIRAFQMQELLEKQRNTTYNQINNPHSPTSPYYRKD